MSIHKALLVDDSKSARFFLRNLLQKNGVEVDMVDSGEAALEYLKEHRPHLIFMDHLMPGIDGFETTRAIKQNPDTSQVPVVMCTSNEGEEYVERAKSIGAADILPKPPTESKLHKILGELTSSPPSAAAAPGISRAGIEAVARSAADAAVRASLDSLVQQLLTSRLAELRRELQQQTEAQVRQIVAEPLKQAGEAARDEVLAASRQQTETIADAIARDAANTILESGRVEAVQSAREAAAESVQAWQKEWLADRDTLLAQAEDRASTASKAAVSALRSANEDAVTNAAQAAEKAAGQVAERAAGQAAERVGMVIMGSIDKDLGRAKLYAAAAALVGILAAVLVYLLG